MPFFSELPLPLCLHRYVFSPVWTLACILKITFTCKSLVTMSTFIWFLLSMIFCMYLKMTSRKIFVTMAALKWPSPMCVVVWYFKYQFPKKKFSKQLHWYGFSPVWILICFFESGQILCVFRKWIKTCLLWAILATIFALVCRLCRMNPCMYFKNTFTCKSLFKMTTFIWFLPSMFF